jgi:hypothetical protein
MNHKKQVNLDAFYTALPQARNLSLQMKQEERG